MSRNRSSRMGNRDRDAARQARAARERAAAKKQEEATADTTTGTATGYDRLREKIRATWKPQGASSTQAQAPENAQQGPQDVPDGSR